MKKHPIFKRTLSCVLAATLALSVTSAFAADVTYDVPTAPLTVDENLILCAAHAQADVTPEILGITNTTDRAGEIPAEYDLNKASTSPLMGVFGGDINDSPNPFLYNWRYNCYAKENNLPLTDKVSLGGVSGHPNSVDSTIVDELGTSRSLYYRADILVGTQIMGQGASYAELIAQLPENTDEDKTNDYNPYNINYAMGVTYDFLDTAMDLAETCNQITKDTGKVTRYGDPVAIVNDLSKYVKGLQCYVLSCLEKDGAEQKTVAIVDPINSKDGIFYCVDENTSVQGTTTHSRPGEFVADTTINIANVLGKEAQSGQVGSKANATYYTLTAEEVLQADLIIISGTQNADGDEAAFRELLMANISADDKALNDKAENIDIFSTRFKCVGSIGANSIENLLGMAYWTSYCYPEYVNPVYVATYWYQNFYHITDNSKLQTIIAANFADASIPSGYNYTTDITGFNPADIEAKVITGMEYYEANSSKLTDLKLYNEGNGGKTGWKIDWTTGIGAGKLLKDMTFTDIKADDWCANAVAWAQASGLSQGTGDNKFSPKNTLTVAGMVQMLYNAAGSPAVETTEKGWFANAKAWGIKEGYIDAATDTSAQCTRLMVVDMMYKAANSPACEAANPFTDTTAASAVWAASEGITAGTTATTFAPDITVTRAQAVQFIYNAR